MTAMYASFKKEATFSEQRRNYNQLRRTCRYIEICERVQKGLESFAYDRGRFSVECEEGVYHFQCLLKKSYKRFLVENGNNAILKNC